MVIEAPSDPLYLDELTGLPNRAWLNVALPKLEISHPGDFALMFLDLDGFKNTNDTYGHAVGDQMLQQAAHVLGLFTRDTDVLLVRPHGDEFILLLPGIHNPEDLELTRQRMQESMDQSDLPVSIGGNIHSPGELMESFMHRCDLEMQANKRERKIQKYDEKQIEAIGEIGRIATESDIILRDLPFLIDALGHGSGHETPPWLQQP